MSDTSGERSEQMTPEDVIRILGIMSGNGRDDGLKRMQDAVRALLQRAETAERERDGFERSLRVSQQLVAEHNARVMPTELRGMPKKVQHHVLRVEAEMCVMATRIRELEAELRPAEGLPTWSELVDRIVDGELISAMIGGETTRAFGGDGFNHLCEEFDLAWTGMRELLEALSRDPDTGESVDVNNPPNLRHNDDCGERVSGEHLVQVGKTVCEECPDCHYMRGPDCVCKCGVVMRDLCQFHDLGHEFGDCTCSAHESRLPAVKNDDAAGEE